VTPTWYDVLGVEPEAPDETIRAAWRSGIADLDPGDRRFRSLNDAAEVLLDRDRRAAYDATLAPEPAPTVAEPEVRLETSTVEAGTAPTPTPSRRSVPAWVLAVLAVLTLVMAASAAYLVTQPSDDAVGDATSDAQGAAERAAVKILAYDYRTLDEDQKAAGELMTPDYRKDYDKLFEVIKDNAAEVKPVVTVEVVASGVVRSGEDRVQVLVFVNRPTTNAATAEPKIYRDQVRMTMVKSGSDWLVDDMQTGPTAT
jgi:Mce-associated membrane protein